MEKRLRSSLKTSAEEFLCSAAKLGFKSAKPSLKTLIHGIAPSSELCSSLPHALCQCISESISRFKKLSKPGNVDPAKSPASPPAKKLRRSSRHSRNGEDPSGNDREAKLVDDRESMVQNLQIYNYVALLCVLHPKKVFSPSDLLPAVQELHDSLVVFESDSALLSEIANLCEEWWKEVLPGREILISQSLPFLLSRSLTLKKKVDVHRVYMLREAFSLFDYEDESIEDLKHLLIRCLISPLYLKTEDGRKFIAFMFGLSGQLMKESLAMIRSQIPFGRKSMLEAYADILFRGWKIVEGQQRDEMENGFLQGLIEGAIHAGSATFAASIRKVLGGFINQRTTDGVEKLLFRLAEPVIFRSLQVANSNVRQNALHLLLDMFPLEDPDCTKEVKDTLLDKQFFLLDRLLMDECPDVRVVAVEGSCRILHMFWEIIPSSTITKIITKIFDDMTHDRCNEVRLSALNGIIYLFGNPQSHQILKVLLPRLGHLILDPANSVRAVLADLLLLFRDIRSFHFHKVVPLDALLSTLANDQPIIAQKITKLLMPSYFPSKITLEEACQRCVTLIKRSPMAGARFCEFALSEGASYHSLMELVKVFINLVLSPNDLNQDQIEGLLVASAYLCNNLVNEASNKTTLQEFFNGGMLRCLFVTAATNHARSSICDIISSVHPDGFSSLFEECLALVTDCCGLSEDMELQRAVRSAHKMMLSCNFFDEMFDRLNRVLQKASYECHAKFGIDVAWHIVPSAKQRKSKSTIRLSTKWKCTNGKKSSNKATSTFEEVFSLASGIAWQIKELLLDENTEKAVLESQNLESVVFALKVISEVSIVQCMHCDYMDVSPIFAYTALALHMYLRNVSISDEDGCGTKKSAGTDSHYSLEPTLLEKTMNHLFKCSGKLLEVGFSSKSAKLPSKAKDMRREAHDRGKTNGEPETNSLPPDDGGPVSTKLKRVSNAVKVLSAVLKFVVDANAMRVTSQVQGRCLMFARNYVKFIMSLLKEYKLDPKEEDLKEIFLCMKSSFTYAAKLLNLILAGPNEALSLLLEAHNLSNSLLDLFVSIELYLGSGYAARILTIVKPWLPELILALGSRYMQKWNGEDNADESSLDQAKSSFPSWPSILANTEIHELNEVRSGEEDFRVSEQPEFPTFKKLVGMLSLRLRGNADVLDAAGMFFLTGAAVGLERNNYGLVSGLLHFVCVKLVRHELGEWVELKMMLAYLRIIFPLIERAAEESNRNEDERQMLKCAIGLLEPIWISYIYGTEDHMEEAE
ncbi:hypothetical protein NMG60_11005964 [Bertholletia excelsa]